MKTFKITENYTLLKGNKALASYLNELHKIKPFDSPNEEYDCALRAFQGDSKAAEELVNRNLRFVVSVAKAYQGKTIPLSDLINEGNLGLIEAVRLYDPTKGFKFISYAVWWIRRRLTEYVNITNKQIKIPSNRISDINKVKMELTKIEQREDRTPTLVDLEDSGLQGFDVERAYNLYNNGIIKSLSESAGDYDDNITLIDTIADTSPTLTDDKLNKSDQKIVINSLLNRLTPDYRLVITMVFGLNGTEPMRLDDIATKLNISKETVRKYRDKAIKKMHFNLTKNGKDTNNLVEMSF
jgi:RNA polymerase primary sigma factor